jgi:hypothetical protein
MRGPAFFAYADNYLIDVNCGIIMDVKASRAVRQAEVEIGMTDLVGEATDRPVIEFEGRACNQKQLQRGSWSAQRRFCCRSRLLSRAMSELSGQSRPALPLS